METEANELLRGNKIDFATWVRVRNHVQTFVQNNDQNLVQNNVRNHDQNHVQNCVRKITILLIINMSFLKITDSKKIDFIVFVANEFF